ncbi:FecR domain-containing protein [Achromobacter xylosoxidans]
MAPHGRDRSWQAGRAPPRKRRTALALALVAVAGITAYTLRDFQPGADYASDTQPLRVALPDGSRAILDAHSAIALDFGPDRREVRLLAGRALFEAAPAAPTAPPSPSSRRTPPPRPWAPATRSLATATQPASPSTRTRWRCNAWPARTGNRRHWTPGNA